MRKYIVAFLFCCMLISCDQPSKVISGNVVEKEIIRHRRGYDDYVIKITGWNQMTGGFSEEYVYVDEHEYFNYGIGDKYEMPYQNR